MLPLEILHANHRLFPLKCAMIFSTITTMVHLNTVLKRKIKGGAIKAMVYGVDLEETMIVNERDLFHLAVFLIFRSKTTIFDNLIQKVRARFLTQHNSEICKKKIFFPENARSTNTTISRANWIHYCRITKLANFGATTGPCFIVKPRLYRKSMIYKKHHVYLFDDNVNKSEWYYICKEDTTTSLDNIEVKNEFKVDLRIIQNEIVQPLDTVV
ncbi:hypothetical protein AB4K20DRAFT_1865866 [Rhizopus microsporus]